MRIRGFTVKLCPVIMDQFYKLRKACSFHTVVILEVRKPKTLTRKSLVKRNEESTLAVKLYYMFICDSPAMWLLACVTKIMGTKEKLIYLHLHPSNYTQYLQGWHRGIVCLLALSGK
ncbi:hypothetical protein XELAEV_18025903mg [Xenopus laevis]|uniref:Uncharacterized protein n=1 Tax=Xenopus laevis TaxID=8355 RepID=A0A974D0G3_XENLA|nr:hypothetical protein XELAEV_18025903mg [Xenopus laevis]